MSSFFAKLKTIALFLALGGFIFSLGYGYFCYQKQQKIRSQQQDLENYQIVKEKIGKEKTNCQTLINQGQGGFSQFEYCKQFLDWSDTLPLSP